MTRARVSALIAAAGGGERLALGPKALLPLHGRPLLAWVVDKMRQVADEVVVALPPEAAGAPDACLHGCRVIAGGTTRQQSIEGLVEAATAPVVLVHEVARPFATVALLRAVLQPVIAGADLAAAFHPPQVPVAQWGADGRLDAVLEAAGVALVQTPQAFQRPVLVELLTRARAQGWHEASLVPLALRAGLEPVRVAGEPQNIKITTAADWRLAQCLIPYLT